jgi:hypothetical protein
MKEIFATAILCFAVSAAQSQAPPAAENDKPKDPTPIARCTKRTRTMIPLLPG